MQQDLPEPVTTQDAGGCGCGTCSCGANADAPVLDVRLIPREVRHAAVLGAVASVPEEGSIVLLAPHDPIPLLLEIDKQEPDAFRVVYDEVGPETWAVRLIRTA